MSENNLPPFYIGQRVIRIENDINGFIEKGVIYIVQDMKYCCSKWGWRIKLAGISHEKPAMCEGCGEIDWFTFAAKNFAPVEENFEMVSYKEVIRKEKPLTCAN